MSRIPFGEKKMFWGGWKRKCCDVFYMFPSSKEVSRLLQTYLLRWSLKIWNSMRLLLLNKYFHKHCVGNNCSWFYKAFYRAWFSIYYCKTSFWSRWKVNLENSTFICKMTLASWNACHADVHANPMKPLIFICTMYFMLINCCHS